MGLIELRKQAQTPIRDGFTAFDLMAVTLEDGDFLYALVRVTKPEIVVESGSGNGISGTFIATALQDNGKGRLITYENADNFYFAALRQLQNLPADVRMGEAINYDWRGMKPGIVYIDSDMGRRHQDMKHFLTCGYKGLVVVHDACRDFSEINDYGTGVLLPGADGLWVGRSREHGG